MGTFSIKDIEAVSGIKCHTLRIWEQRYSILCPKRTGTNIRYYDDEDLKLILNISILNKYGYRISHISKMCCEEINEAILKISDNANEFSCQIKGLVQAMMMFDEKEFHKILSTNIQQAGFEETMLKIVFPFMLDIGLLWQVGSVQPSHEHFATNIIKQKIYVALDEYFGKFVPGNKRFLLFLPEKEQHSLGLLFANYLIRRRGHEVLYLGQEVSLKSLKAMLGNHSPDYIFTILTSSHLDIDKQKFTDALAENWKKVKSYYQDTNFLRLISVVLKNVKLVRTMEEFILLLENISEMPGKN